MELFCYFLRLMTFQVVSLKGRGGARGGRQEITETGSLAGRLGEFKAQNQRSGEEVHCSQSGSHHLLARKERLEKHFL